MWISAWSACVSEKCTARVTNLSQDGNFKKWARALTKNPTEKFQTQLPFETAFEGRVFKFVTRHGKTEQYIKRKNAFQWRRTHVPRKSVSAQFCRGSHPALLRAMKFITASFPVELMRYLSLWTPEFLAGNTLDSMRIRILQNKARRNSNNPWLSGINVKKEQLQRSVLSTAEHVKTRMAKLKIPHLQPATMHSEQCVKSSQQKIFLSFVAYAAQSFGKSIFPWWQLVAWTGRNIFATVTTMQAPTTWMLLLRVVALVDSDAAMELRSPLFQLVHTTSAHE